MEKHSFRIAFGKSHEIMRKLFLSIKFPNQEIKQYERRKKTGWIAAATTKESEIKIDMIYFQEKLGTDL